MDGLDNLLSDEQLNVIEEIGELSCEIRQYLHDNYAHSKQNVDYIYYTGIGCNDNLKHTIEEYTNCVADIFDGEYKWYELVVLGGASVVWKI